MAATEGLQIRTVVIKYDPALVERENITDVPTRLLSRVDFFRKVGKVHLCTVIIAVASIDWKNGAFPPPARVNLVKGLTEMTIE